jgi:1-acyl-sn-glycerol-3-phosphate acyltransferase
MITLFGVCAYFATRIKLEEDITSFMPGTAETERTNFVLRNISTNDKIIVNLSVSDSTLPDIQDYLITWADAIVDSLHINPGENYIKDIFYKVDDSKIIETGDFILGNLPLFLNKGDYQRLDSILNQAGVKKTLEQNRKDLVSPIGVVYKKFLISDPFNISNRIFTDLRLNAVDSLYSVYNDYIFSKDGKNLLIFITSAHSIGETGQNAILAKSLEYNIKKISERSDGKVVVTSFGASIVGVSNASQIKKDSYIATAISLVLIVFLLFSFFRSMRSLVLIIIPVVFGAVFSLAILFLLKGTISAIAIGAGSVILGIAINYSLHFLVHYKHCGSVGLTIKDLASPLVIGNITTVGAFLSLLFVSAEALRDFGLFASLALIGTILFVLIFMPHFVPGKSSDPSHYPAFFDRISEVRFDKNIWVITVIVLLTIFFSFFSRHLTFETDLNKISYMTPDQKKALKELGDFTSLSQKSIIHVSEGADLDESLTNYERVKNRIDSLLKMKAIISVTGVGDMLMSDTRQKQKIDQWHNFWVKRKQTVSATLKDESLKMGFKVNSFDMFLNSLNKEYTILNPDELLTKVSFLSPYIIKKPDRTLIITLLSLDLKNEDTVKKALSNQPGTFVFDRVSATKATLGILSKDFNFVLWVSALLVLVFLTISFGRPELSLLTFIPMLIGWIWILGIMAIFNVKFNIVNIILATFIFGLCDDYSIFIMEGSMLEHSRNRKILNSYKLAVILSALTMFIGIGTLIIAKHPAMKSLGQVTIIGMVSVVVISYTILPFLYRWLNYKKGEKRQVPITARNLLNSIYSFTAFLIGSIFHSILGFILFKVTRPSDQKKLFFHKCLAFTAGFVVKRIPNVKTRIINQAGENFEKPSIIISNHQSHIDLMLIMMLSPRVVILTNEWVWNSPFYGSIVKNADFYPVIKGIESSLDHLSRLIEKGYSIMIFPEGTRSADCSINRFHRGAFFLAEQLKLDILPVMIHGMGHVLPKTDFLLRKGEVTVEIMERIKCADKSYGETYSVRAKNIRAMYRSRYRILAEEIETPRYYADKLFHNYLYKGPAITAQVTAELYKHNNYSEIIRQLPVTGRVLVFGTGIGTFPLMLSFVRTEIEIYAVESDEDKLSLARNCASAPDRISFIHDNPLDFRFLQKYDSIVLIDCLSVYNKIDQHKIIDNCLINSSLVLVSDIEYSRFKKMLLKLRGVEIQNVKNHSLSDLEKLSGEICFNIIQKDNIFAVSKAE